MSKILNVLVVSQIPTPCSSKLQFARSNIGLLPERLLAHLGDQLGDELSPACGGNGNGGNWARGKSKRSTSNNGSNNGTLESGSNDDLTGTIGDEDAVSGDGPEGLALPLGLHLLEGVRLPRGSWHKVSDGRGQDAADKLEIPVEE